MNSRILVVGLGYVGTAIAVLLSKKHDVKAVDIDDKKVKLINNFKSPILDDEISDFLLQPNLSIEASTRLDDYVNNNIDFIIIALPTNFDNKLNRFNTDSIEELLKKFSHSEIISNIVIKSTVPIGFTEAMQKKYPKLSILFSPEFLREGKALYDNLNPSRIIMGGEVSICQDFIKILQESASIDNIPSLIMKTSEAEAVKLFSNNYLAMRVAFFNEVDNLALANDFSSSMIISGICMDNRIGNFYNNPSFGYGGYCLPKDTKQLRSDFKNVPEKLISATIDSNKIRKIYIADYIINLNPSAVGIYRLAMKSGSDNLRDSSIIDIIKKIRDNNIEVFIYEPILKDNIYNNCKVIKDLSLFKKNSDLILANRNAKELDDVANKVFSRDIFNNN